MRKLLEEFNIQKSKNNYDNYDESDYQIFPDKELLDSFRTRILEDLSDKGFNHEEINENLINTEIDNITYGYSLSNKERRYLFNLIDGETNGYGPLTELLSDKSVTSIMVNSPNSIYIEVHNQLKKEDNVSFINDDHILRTIERLINQEYLSIESNNHIIDAKLGNFARLHAILPPLAKHPTVTIKKINNLVDDIGSLISNGTLTPDMARFLESCVIAKLNILVSGTPGSGKTTLLNMLGNFIPEDERIITIENISELKMVQNNVISLEAKNNNGQSLTTDDLIKEGLAMRPDRLILGEVNSHNALSILEAMNTGYLGSMTSIYANNPFDALKKLTTTLLINNDIKGSSLKELIGGCLDIVVQITKMNDGRRKVNAIFEVVGLVDNELVLSPIFEFTKDEAFTSHMPTPTCLEKMREHGLTDISEMFKTSKATKTKRGPRQGAKS